MATIKEILVVDNFPLTNIAQESTLTADAAAAQAVVTVANPNDFVTDGYVLIGTPGQDTAELRKILSVSGKDITFTANLSTAHQDGEKIYAIRANQIKIYRAANVDGSTPADGSFSAVATLDIDADQIATEYVDSVGGTGYWYKSTYYNSTTTDETSIADSEAQRGGNFGHYTTIEDIRIEAGLQTNDFIENQQISDKRDLAESEINATLVRAGYDLPFDEVPGVIKNIADLLSAGYVLLADYGPGFDGTNKEGSAKIAQARALLAQILSGDLQILDVNLDPITSTSSSNVRGYPDDTAEDMVPSEGRMFTVSDKY